MNMTKRPHKRCENCDEYMMPIEGTKQSWYCGFCGAKVISSSDKELVDAYIRQLKAERDNIK